MTAEFYNEYLRISTGKRRVWHVALQWLHLFSLKSNFYAYWSTALDYNIIHCLLLFFIILASLRDEPNEIQSLPGTFVLDWTIVCVSVNIFHPCTTTVTSINFIGLLLSMTVSHALPREVCGIYVAVICMLCF